MPRFPRPIAAASLLTALVLAVVLSAAAVASETPWHEDFEGPQTSWHQAGGDARSRLVEHQRVQGDAHSGNGCEWLRLQAENGSAVYISHDIGRPRVIEEVVPAVWIRSDRPGLQLYAQVVLPRSLDPRTGQPMSMLIAGTSYSDVGRWQQLHVDDLPRLVERQVRVLRSQLRAPIDEHEAYIANVALNIYGGPGVTNVWIDDLEVAGFVTVGPGMGKAAIPRAAAGPLTAEYAAIERPQPRRVALVGSVLTVDGRPFFPRMIQYQGEPLALLKQLGFNTVWLEQPPSPALLEEASRLHLWLVCPPPRPADADSLDAASAPPIAIGPQLGCVLAWNLGVGLAHEDLDRTKRWAQQVRAADRAGGRPLICRAETDLRDFSRQADLLLLDRRPLGSSLELTDYAAWLRQQPRLARPGTPIWTTVQTQASPALLAQLGALEPGRSQPAAVADEQVRLLVYTAVAAGSRGLLMLSDTPLSADDPQTRQRAMALELLNLELDLIEPWGAAGEFLANVAATEPEVTATVLRADRSRLLMPMWLSPGSQYVPAQSAAAALSLVVPGVPESSNAYELTAGGMQTLRHKRVTGGVSVTLDEFGLAGLVLLAQDPLIIESLSQRSAAIGKRAAELRRELAARKLRVVDETAAQLADRSTNVNQVRQAMQAARQSLQVCDGRLTAKEYQAAYRAADHTLRALRWVERSYWDKAVEGLASPLTSPFAANFATLPSHWRLAQRIVASRPGPNRLAGGDFEDVGLMVQAGWRNFQHPSPGVQTATDLVPAAAHSGVRGLRLTARPQDASAPALLETPPLWITTPPVPVDAGQLVCIHGWLATPTPISGSVDGLLIVDSLAGEDMALRLNRTVGWQEFTTYRAAPSSGPMTVTFVLTGLGEVYLDDVTIQVMEPPGAAGVTRLPPVER